MVQILSGLAVLAGYLLGSIPSAYLMGRLKGQDLTVANGDGRLGTRLAFRRLGKAAGLTVAFMDFGKGVAAIVVARALDVPASIVLLGGFAAVAGHDWSVFLGFKGGRGAMVSYGVLASLALWGFLIALAIAGIFLLFTRKSTLATVILFSVLTVILWLRSPLDFPPMFPWEPEFTSGQAIFPLMLIIPIALKHIHIRKQRQSGGEWRASEAGPKSR